METPLTCFPSFCAPQTRPADVWRLSCAHHGCASTCDIYERPGRDRRRSRSGKGGCRRVCIETCVNAGRVNIDLHPGSRGNGGAVCSCRSNVKADKIRRRTSCFPDSQPGVRRGLTLGCGQRQSHTGMPCGSPQRRCLFRFYTTRLNATELQNSCRWTPSRRFL